MGDILTNVSKIEKWNLADEVVKLNKDGLSSQSIANHISSKYPDIEELRDISHMAVNRYLTSYRENEVKLELDEIRDPAKYIHDEFNSKIRDNIQDAERMNNLVNEFSIKLQDKDNISITELNRLVNSWKKTNDQIRINLVALRQFADTQIIKPTQNIIYKKEINIKNMILDISRGLCPECKSKIQQQIEEYSLP